MQKKTLPSLLVYSIRSVVVYSSNERQHRIHRFRAHYVLPCRCSCEFARRSGKPEWNQPHMSTKNVIIREASRRCRRRKRGSVGNKIHIFGSIPHICNEWQSAVCAQAWAMLKCSAVVVAVGWEHTSWVSTSLCTAYTN